MKKLMSLISVLFAFTMVIFVMTSCKKSDDSSGPNEIQQAQDNVKAEWIYEDAGNMAESGISGSLNMKSGADVLSNCATVTIDTVAIPHTLVIDFGNSNCLCNDGNYRKGKILVQFMGRYFETGSYHTISFEDYYINDNMVTGSRYVSNNGPDSLGFMNWTVTVAGELTLANNAGSISWNANRLRTLIQGASTPARLDDVYEITGSGSGSRLNGTEWTAIIQTPLRLELSCMYRHPVSGEVLISIANKPDRHLNYGTGSCDNVATVAINGISYNITLH